MILVQLSPEVQSFQLASSDRLPYLGLDADLGGKVVENQIHLISIGVLPIIEIQIQVVVKELLDVVADQKGLEYGSSRGVEVELIRRTDSQQVTEQARVQKVELWALCDPLVEILVIRPEKEDLKTRFEDR